MSINDTSTGDPSLDLNNEMSANEAHEFLFGEAFFTQEMRELLQGDVSYGEGDNTDKARRVLEWGARQILEDKTSSAFMRYVAICIGRHLNEKISLDEAFSRKKGRGRPKRDPQQDDHIIAAFYAAASSPEAIDEDTRRKLAFDAAFTAQHGMSEKEFRERVGDEKSIDNRKVKTRQLLQSRGLYWIPSKKST